MTQFEVSNYARLLSQLDKRSGQNIEYWSKKDETKTYRL